MKKQSLMAMTVPYDTGEHCIMVHMTSHYPNFPDHRKNACNWDEIHPSYAQQHSLSPASEVHEPYDCLQACNLPEPQDSRAKQIHSLLSLNLT